MKTCHIYPVSAGAGVYHWKWRCVEGKRKSTSSRSFELFYDCVCDARKHGYQPRISAPKGSMPIACP